MLAYYADYLIIEFDEITISTVKGLHLSHISYSELTGSDTLFRENSELMDDEYLRVFAMQSQYNV